MKQDSRDKSQKDVSDDGDDQEALDEEDGHDDATLVRNRPTIRASLGSVGLIQHQHTN